MGVYKAQKLPPHLPPSCPPVYCALMLTINMYKGPTYIRTSCSPVRLSSPNLARPSLTLLRYRAVSTHLPAAVALGRHSSVYIIQLPGGGGGGGDTPQEARKNSCAQINFRDEQSVCVSSFLIHPRRVRGARVGSTLRHFTDIAPLRERSLGRCSCTRDGMGCWTAYAASAPVFLWADGGSM